MRGYHAVTTAGRECQCMSNLNADHAFEFFTFHESSCGDNHEYKLKVYHIIFFLANNFQKIILQSQLQGESVRSKVKVRFKVRFKVKVKVIVIVKAKVKVKVKVIVIVRIKVNIRIKANSLDQSQLWHI